MANITFKGNAIQTAGELPAVGTEAPNFTLTGSDLSEVSLSDFKGKKVILNIFPSIDTGTCATSVREFNQRVSSLDNTVVLCISKDLPFAQSRFCAAEGIENVKVLSEFKNQSFSEKYPITIKSAPLDGLLSRAVVVIDENGKVAYTEQVSEVSQEPNYEAALAAL